MVVSQLRMEMSRALYETWVQPLRPLTYENGSFVLSAANPYAREWVENRLGSRITRLLEGLYNQPVNLELRVANAFFDSGVGLAEAVTDLFPVAESPASENKKRAPSKSLQPSRKVMLQRAYGSERAGVIQPERGMFVTLYFFYQWLPLLGHSAATAILAARSMCYWNPLTGDLRNVIETDMSELARRAAVSLRTVKDVLNQDLVRKYFIRYRVRRMMTPNGVRTAGISLQVRMDDPLTPEDQAAFNISEDDWYLPEFDDPKRQERGD